MAEEAGGEPVETPGWMFHNFRWAGVTALADAGFAPVCQRAEFLAERKAALEAWAALAGQELS